MTHNPTQTAQEPRTDAPTIRTTPRIPRPARVQAGQYDLHAPQIETWQELADDCPPLGEPLPTIATEPPPRDTIQIETAAEAAQRIAQSALKTWGSWGIKRQFAAVAVLISAIWAAWIACNLYFDSYTLLEWCLIGPLVTMLYLGALASVGAVWLFIRPAKW